MYAHVTDVMMADEGGDPLGVCAAHAALKEHEEWLSDGFNAALVCPEDPTKAKAPVKLGETLLRC